MASKPRKAFDGVGRPQGFIDDAVLGVLKAASRVKNVGKKGEASLLSPMSKKKFEKIYGKQPPKPKELPSIKGKSPRPMPSSKGNPRAQTTAQADMTQRKAERDWAKNKRKNYRG
jgi:hypothetical protein